MRPTGNGREEFYTSRPTGPLARAPAGMILGRPAVASDVVDITADQSWYPGRGTSAWTKKRRRRRQGRRVVRLVLVVSLVVGALVLLPKVHAPERLAFYRTSVGTPETVANYTLALDSPGGDVALAQQQLAGTRLAPATAHPLLATYEDDYGSPALIVLVAKLDRPHVGTAALDSAFVDLARAGIDVGTVSALAPGPLGGAARCARVVVGLTAMRACAVLDPAVRIDLLFRDPATSDATVLAVRAGVESRR